MHVLILNEYFQLPAMVCAMSKDDTRISRDHATRFVSSASYLRGKKKMDRSIERQVSRHADRIGFAVSQAPVVDRGV